MGNLRRDIERLKFYRENNERKSREVIQSWESSISHNLDNLGKERYIILEQICVAALDCYRVNIAERCIQELYKEFPRSSRVSILEAMLYEVDENYSKALLILNDIIKHDATHSAARKRKVAIYKSVGKNIEAIKELTDYVKVFMADVEAWQELSELYIIEHDYAKAAFCAEELILHNPHNHLYHLRYADIKYTQGGVENFDVARTYYYQVLKLNPDNMRALYGIYLSTTGILNASKSLTTKKKEAANKIIAWSLGEIKKKYSAAAVSNIEQSLTALVI